MNTDKMIARRIRLGYNEAASRALLAQLVAAHDGDNLAFALQYNGFTNTISPKREDHR